MKFWDTIAKMCGVTAWVAPERRRPITGITTGAGGVIETVTDATIGINIGPHAIVASNGMGDVVVTVNGHGVRLTDSMAYAKGCPRQGLNIGLIDIVRIRPMATKTGDVSIGIASNGARMSQEKLS